MLYLKIHRGITGKKQPLPVIYQGEHTLFERNWHMHDSLLLYVTLEEGKEEADEVPESGAEWRQFPVQLGKVPAKPQEPNALLLDMAEYALDEEAYRPAEELLRCDNVCRRALGMPERKKKVVQPYLLEEKRPEHRLRLRFEIDSEIRAEGLKLALEDAAQTELFWNGERVSAKPDGWYVDEAIETVPLPPLHPGRNVLELRLPFGERTNTEWCYLLGDFGVRVEGAVKTVTAPVRNLAYGDITCQGYPFYTGNLVYHHSFELEEDGEIRVRVPRYAGALVGVSLDGGEEKPLITAPYTVQFSGVKRGRHCLELKLYGTRQNGFGQIHHTSGVFFYQSPDSWRSVGDLWSYPYQLRPVGILKSPEIFYKKDGKGKKNR